MASLVAAGSVGDVVAIAVINWVFNNSETKNGTRLVMLSLADNCNEGGECFPSTAETMRKTNLSRRAVFIALDQAQELGELTMDSGGGRHRINSYRININSSLEERQQLGKEYMERKVAKEPTLKQSKSKTCSDLQRVQNRHRLKPPTRTDIDVTYMDTVQILHETVQNSASNGADSAPGTVKEPSGTVKVPPSAGSSLRSSQRVRAREEDQQDEQANCRECQEYGPKSCYYHHPPLDPNEECPF